MNRKELSHLLRAAARIADDPEILVLGSQAILGTYDDQCLPAAVTMSVEADFAFRIDPDEVKADKVDGDIGELSSFHEEFGYYAQGVSLSTAELPSGWENRVIRYDQPDAEPSEAVCLDAHDLVVSKLCAGREKDKEFASALLSCEKRVGGRLAAGFPTQQGLFTRRGGVVRGCGRPAPGWRGGG